MPAPSALSSRLIDLARDAAAAIVEVHRRGFTVTDKADSSPLTEADLASNRVLIAGLAGIEPLLPVISEESLSVPWATRAGWSRYWLVDPLDGTKEFVGGNDHFTVNIALIDDGRPTLGIVVQPLTGTGWIGEVGSGAWRIEADGRTTALRCDALGEAPLRVAVSRSHAGGSTARFLAGLGPHVCVATGSSLKLCHIADGHLDLYPRPAPTMEWDIGAGQAVLEAAGGRVVVASGEALAYNRKDSLLNDHFVAVGDQALIDRDDGALLRMLVDACR